MGIGHHGRTYRLDWEDVSIRDWDCTVVWSDPAAFSYVLRLLPALTLSDSELDEGCDTLDAVLTQK